jgi:hypothetical protein
MNRQGRSSISLRFPTPASYWTRGTELGFVVIITTPARPGTSLFVLIDFLAGKRMEWFVGGLGPGFLIMSAIVEDLSGWCHLLAYECEPHAADHDENDDVGKGSR